MKINAKYVVFTLIAVASTYVLYHNERFLIDGSDPAWQRYESFKDVSLHWKDIRSALSMARVPARSGAPRNQSMSPLPMAEG